MGRLRSDSCRPAAIETPPGMFSRLALIADWLELTWNEWIINYDFNHQVQLAQSMQLKSRNWRDVAREWFDQKQNAGKTWLRKFQFRNEAIGMLLPILLIGFLAVLRFNLIAHLVRRAMLYLQLRKKPSAQNSPLIASRLYVEMLRALKKAGLTHQETQTPNEFAAQIKETALARVVSEFTQLYSAARFGGAAENLEQLQKLLGQIRAAARSH